jgi:hypothetical protein
VDGTDLNFEAGDGLEADNAKDNDNTDRNSNILRGPTGCNVFSEAYEEKEDDGDDEIAGVSRQSSFATYASAAILPFN